MNCLKNNLNLRIKTEPVTVGADFQSWAHATTTVYHRRCNTYVVAMSQC